MLKYIVESFVSLVSPSYRAQLARAVEHERYVLRVMTVLPGKHRYEQVEAAINASGVSPDSLYWSLAANSRTFALERFYEALNGPK